MWLDLKFDVKVEILGKRPIHEKEFKFDQDCQTDLGFTQIEDDYEMLELY